MSLLGVIMEKEVNKHMSVKMQEGGGQISQCTPDQQRTPKQVFAPVSPPSLTLRCSVALLGKVS